MNLRDTTQELHYLLEIDRSMIEFRAEILKQFTFFQNPVEYVSDDMKNNIGHENHFTSTSRSRHITN